MIKYLTCSVMICLLIKNSFHCMIYNVTLSTSHIHNIFGFYDRDLNFDLDHDPLFKNGFHCFPLTC